MFVLETFLFLQDKHLLLLYFIIFKINKKYCIIVEPLKKNTSPAIASTLVIQGVFNNDPMIFFPADHLIENTSKLYKSIYE